MSHEFTIGVDLDGVVADYQSRLREIAADILKIDTKHFPPARTWNLADAGWPIQDEAHFFEIHRQAVAELLAAGQHTCA